eukprot:gene3746-4320_t
MKLTGTSVFIGLLLVSIGFVAAQKASTKSLSGVYGAGDRALLVKLASSGASFASKDLKQTYFAIGALTRLGETLPTTNELCSEVRAHLNGQYSSMESVFYGVSILSELKCLAANPLSLEDIGATVKASLASGQLDSMSQAVNTIFLLMDAKAIDYELATLEPVATSIVSLMDSEGLFKSSSADASGSLSNTGGAYFTLARLAHRINNSAVTALVTRVAAKIDSVLSHATDSESSYSFGDLQTTTTLLRGIIALASKADKIEKSFTSAQITKIGEYLLRFKNVSTLSDAFHLVIGMKSCQRNAIGQPLAVILDQSAFPAAASNALTLAVKDIFGQDVTSAVTISKLAATNARQTALLSGKDMTYANNQYSVNLEDLKLGSYAVDIKVTPTDNNYTPFTVSRIITVTGSVLIKDFKLSIAEAKEGLANSKNAHEVAFGSKLPSVVSIPQQSFARVFFRVASGEQNFVAQQVGVRFSSPSAEVVVPASYSVDAYSYIMVNKDLAKLLNQHSGSYQVEIIVGDSSIGAPLTWSVGEVALNFAGAPLPVTRFQEHQPIAHKFRVPDVRPNQTISQAFTLLVLSPALIFLVGLLAIGVNFNRIPGGMGFLYTVGFIGCIASIAWLIIQYWISLTMVVTLRYLGLLMIPTIIIGHQCLSHFSSERTAVKSKIN